MKPRTNNIASVRSGSLRATLSIALALAATGVTSAGAIADDGAAYTSRPVVVTIRPATEEQPSPKHISPDYNRDGIVDINDLFDYLTGWMAGKPAADTNISGTLEVEDVLDYLNLWLGNYGTKQDPARQ